MDAAQDWFDDHGLALDAWRLVEDDNHGNRYAAFTDTPVVTADTARHQRVHEAAHSSVAWNVAGSPDDAFYDRMRELTDAKTWLHETAQDHGIETMVEDSTVLTETDAIIAALAEEQPDTLNGLFDAYDGGDYTDEQLADAVQTLIAARQDDLRDTLTPLYDRMEELQPVVDDPASEAVPMFTSMYETGMVDEREEHVQAFYDEIRASSEYDGDLVVSYLQDMRSDYHTLRDDLGAEDAFARIVTGDAPSTEGLTYTLERA